MPEIKPCPQCETARKVELVTREVNLTMKGRDISFRAKSYRCLDCNEEFDTAETLDRNLESAREKYDELYKTPNREELVTLRAKYGASQKAFGLLLGFGELTINSYEQGAIPDSAHRLLLRLAASPEVFHLIYSENKQKIGAIQRKRIEASDGFRGIESREISRKSQPGIADGVQKKFVRTDWVLPVNIVDTVSSAARASRMTEEDWLVSKLEVMAITKGDWEPLTKKRDIFRSTLMTITHNLPSGKAA